MTSKSIGNIVWAVVLALLACNGTPAFAGEIEGRIESLQRELEELKAQQLKFKKEATAAASVVLQQR